MDDLLSWMGKNQSRVHPLILSSVFHYEFVFIHPFADGNGRMARLWQTALLACMAPGASYSAAELLTLLGLKSRQTLRMHYLDPAIREGLVEMTISEKPSSRNQRYRRTKP